MQEINIKLTLKGKFQGRGTPNSPGKTPSIYHVRTTTRK